MPIPEDQSLHLFCNIVAQAYIPAGKTRLYAALIKVFDVTVQAVKDAFDRYAIRHG
jgi:hypothetical protein